MVFQEITFRIKYDSPYVKISEKYPGHRISMWCVWDRELMHFPSGDPEIVNEIEKEVDKHGMLIDSSRESPGNNVILLKCTCGVFRNVWNITGEHRLVDLFPAVFLDGWAYYKVLSFEDSTLKEFFAELNTLGVSELVSKRNVDFSSIPSNVWVGSLFNELTDKQMDALIKAHDYGYYNSPRNITTESVAKSVGVSRSTYEEHLRKAENRIMESVIPYMKLFRSGRPDKSKLIIPEISLVNAGT